MGSFLDKLLVGALGRLPYQTVVGGQSVQMVQGQIALCDATGSSPNVAAPLNPDIGAVFGVADTMNQAAVHAINITSIGASFKLESPAAAGTFSNSVTIGTAGRVRFWIYVGPSPGWKLIQGVF